MKFVSESNSPKDIVVVGEIGSWATTGAAEVRYRFVCGLLHLEIEDYAFGKKSIDELIQFLEFCKTKVD